MSNTALDEDALQSAIEAYDDTMDLDVPKERLIGAAIAAYLVAAPLPPNEMIVVVAENFAARAARAESTLRFLRDHDGECIGDHPLWISKIDEVLSLAAPPTDHRA